MVPKNLCLITGNPGKAKEFESLLNLPHDHEHLDLVEVQALDVGIVAYSKAIQAYAALGRPVLTDDRCLIVEEWNGLPGALTSWFLDAIGTAGILQMAATLSSRRARAVTALGYADEAGVRVFIGEVPGRLAEEEQRGVGFRGTTQYSSRMGGI